MVLLALRNVLRQFRRYSFLTVSLSVGFAMVILFLGLTQGMQLNLDRKAARYFAGDLSITGYSKSGWDSIDHQEQVLEAINEASLSPLGVCRRTNYLGLDATLFFNGSAARQRRLVGIDWQLEANNFADMEFVAGGVEEMAGSDGVLVSTQVARKTGVRVGDEILLLLTTRGGAQNTARLVVQGVYRESSFFGNTTYLDIETLNRLYGQEPGSSTDMGLMLSPLIDQRQAAEQLRRAMVNQGLNVFGAIDTREQQDQALAETWEGRRYAIMTLRAHLSPIADLLDAVNLVTVFVVAFFLLVVAIGVSNTYRMIIRERRREIGTLRALGLQAQGVQRLLGCEALLVGVVGGGFGLLLGLTLLSGATLIDLGGYGSLLMFLNQGHPGWSLDPLGVLWCFSLLFGACLAGVAGPAVKASRLRPVEALNDHS